MQILQINSLERTFVDVFINTNYERLKDPTRTLFYVCRWLLRDPSSFKWYSTVQVKKHFQFKGLIGKNIGKTMLPIIYSKLGKTI